jgi:hypothetical protein
MTKEREKKQKVIHTRVSESMEEELKERAERLGVSVSNLVRNVLQNTFGLVEDIMHDGANLARSARNEARGRAATGAAAAAEVLGWQIAILNRNAVCEQCNEILPKGAEAAIGIRDGAGARPILCKSCVEELRGSGEEDGTE